MAGGQHRSRRRAQATLFLPQGIAYSLQGIRLTMACGVNDAGVWRTGGPVQLEIYP